MAIGTRKTNATVHPGAILQTNRQPRRTRGQIEEDKARAAATAIVAEEKAAAKYQSVLDRIAELEAAVEREEQGVKVHTLRPDLAAEPLDASNISMRSLFSSWKYLHRRSESKR
jgi:hypothetical protein